MVKHQENLYHVNVSDILYVLEGCHSIIAECPLNMSDFHTDLLGKESLEILDSKVEKNPSSGQRSARRAQSDYKERPDFEANLSRQQVAGSD